MTGKAKLQDPNWQLRHYANVGKEYGAKHFTKADSEFTAWILESIASVKPDAEKIAEIGAGTCIFSSLLGRQMQLKQKVTCFEPVAELLDSHGFENVEAHCGGAAEFAERAPSNTYDLIFTKDTAHHFDRRTLDSIHFGFCQKLKPGGRYLMVVRTPPDNAQVPVGSIASSRWPNLYTSLDDLLHAMRNVSKWREVFVIRWEKEVQTPVDEWIDGVRNQDTWSVFSALKTDEIGDTVRELTDQLSGADDFDFLHQYDVAVFEKL